MKTLGYTLLLAGLLTASAQAQTFGAGNNSASAMQNSQAQNVRASTLQNRSVQSGSATLQQKNLAAEVENENTGQDSFLKDSVTNFSRDDNAQKYDNSTGKVIRFKIVDGEVQFQEDKDRMILIYYDNYKVSKGMDNIVRCTLRLFVLNDLETKVSNLGFKLLWPNISTSLQMQQINPGVSKYSDIMLLGEGCFTMDKTPTVEINRCRVKGLSEEQCADKVKWFAKSRQ